MSKIDLDRPRSTWNDQGRPVFDRPGSTWMTKIDLDRPRSTWNDHSPKIDLGLPRSTCADQRTERKTQIREKNQHGRPWSTWVDQDRPGSTKIDPGSTSAQHAKRKFEKRPAFPPVLEVDKKGSEKGGTLPKNPFYLQEKSTRRQGCPSPHELPWLPRGAARVGGLGTLPGRLDGASPPLPSLPTNRKREESATLASSISVVVTFLANVSTIV